MAHRTVNIMLKVDTCERCGARTAIATEIQHADYVETVCGKCYEQAKIAES